MASITTNTTNGNTSRTDIPTNANKTCVGTNSELAGKVSSCDGCPNQSICASGEARAKSQQINKEVNACVGNIKHKILVLSGKGGVGKSTFSAQMAFNLAKRGHRVGLLDIDICGPSIPLMLGLKNSEVHNSGDGWSPVYVTPDGDENNAMNDDLEGDEMETDEGGMVAVISVGFMLPDNDSAVIWRGPRKNALIKQFLTDVDWGELDYLIVDTPPGTSDEHISIVQYLKHSLQDGKDGCVVITTPQEASMGDVRKELNFCKKTHLNVLGIVENMSGFMLPFDKPNTTPNDTRNQLNIIDNATGTDVTNEMMIKIKNQLPELLNCSVFTNIFTTASATNSTSKVNTPKDMAMKFSVPYLGSLPLDTDYLKACETGKPVPDNTNASKRLNIVIDNMLSKLS